MNVGLKISQLIEKNNLTKKSIAVQLEIARNTLDDYISERTSIPVNKLILLSKIFNIEVKDFFEDPQFEFREKVFKKRPKITIQIELDEEDEDMLLKLIEKKY